MSAAQGGPWFRVPANLPALEPEEAMAWMLVLGLWHGGHDPSIGEIRRRTGWGAGRTTAFMGKVSAWAAENGAAMPVRRADLKRTLKSGGDGNVIGTAAERQRNVSGTDESAEKADNKVLSERERNDGGTIAECYRNDSRARVPSESRSEIDKEGEAPTQPEADWDAIEAAILKARDAEIESYFATPVQPPAPEPTTRKPGPDFDSLFGKLTPTAPTPEPAPEPEPEAPALPPDLDLLQMLTSRPDGGQGHALALAQRWHRALVTAGVSTPAHLGRYTLREIQMLPGMSAPSAGHVRDALEAWGGALAMGGRDLVDSLRKRAFSGKLIPTPAEKRLMDAANIRPLDIRQMSDFDVHTFAQRLDQARSRL